MTDEHDIAGLVERLRDEAASDLAAVEDLGDAPVFAPTVQGFTEHAALMSRAASQLLALQQRVKEAEKERDRERSRQDGMYPTALANWEMRAQSAEARVEALEGGLREIADFRAERASGGNGSYQRGYDNGFNRAGQAAASKARALLHPQPEEGAA